MAILYQGRDRFWTRKSRTRSYGNLAPAAHCSGASVHHHFCHLLQVQPSQASARVCALFRAQQLIRRVHRLQYWAAPESEISKLLPSDVDTSEPKSTVGALSWFDLVPNARLQVEVGQGQELDAPVDASPRYLGFCVQTSATRICSWMTSASTDNRC